nr:hypothetical protein [Acholeplasmatales bacterium]
MFVKSIYENSCEPQYIPTIIMDNIKAITSKITDENLSIGDNLFSIALINLTKDVYKTEYRKNFVNMSAANYDFDEMTYKGISPYIRKDKNKAVKKNNDISGIMIIDNVDIESLNQCAAILNEILIDEIHTENLFKYKNKYLYYGIKYMIDNKYSQHLKDESIINYILNY